MIGPSRRQRGRRPTTPAQDGRLRLHAQVAQRRYWGRRLALCSAGALLASLVAWLAGASLAVHAATAAVGFVIGFLVPLTGISRRALGWVAEQVGLSYLTALEQPDPPDPQADRFGLIGGVQRRAREQSARVELPPVATWWLPLLAIAIGLVLLPRAPLGSGFLRPGGGPVQESNAADALAAEEAETQELEEEAVDPLTPQDPDASRLEQPDLSDRSESFDTPASDPGDVQTPASDRETLSRFLDNLRMREEQPPPPQQQQQQQQRQSVPSDRPPQDTTESQSQNQQQNPDGTPAEAEPDPNGEQPQAGGGEEGDQQQQQEAGSEQPQQEPGQEQSEGSPDQGDPGEQGLEDTPPQGEPSDQADSDPSGNNEESSPEEGSGDQASSERRSNPLTDRADNEPDVLEGVLGPGPENLAGAVRLPGADEVELPNGVSPEAYQRALERAVTEGRIPVEYQEIIRNYFR